MFRIRFEQLDFVGQSRDAAARPEQIAGALRQLHPELVAELEDERLTRRMRIVVARSALYGIDSFSGQLALAALMLEFSPAFDRHPQLRRILRDAARTAEERVSALEELTGMVWEVVRSMGGADPWKDAE